MEKIEDYCEAEFKFNFNDENCKDSVLIVLDHYAVYELMGVYYILCNKYRYLENNEWEEVEHYTASISRFSKPELDYIFDRAYKWKLIDDKIYKRKENVGELKIKKLNCEGFLNFCECFLCRTVSERDWVAVEYYRRVRYTFFVKECCDVANTP